MSNVSMREIRELAGKFVVKPYQRGYKWTAAEVRQLLDDINAFSDYDRKIFYCLQPIIVRTLEVGRYELIDGQQRLTTIYMILAYLRASDLRFTIEYDTRRESTEYLKDIATKGGGVDESKTIDLHYLSAGFAEIDKWFGDDTDLKASFKKKLLDHTKIIWQEISTDASTSAERIFLNFNSGKIPLTDAERIKALFLRGSASTGNLELRILQAEIAQEWDRFESELRNPEFWYFLNGNIAEQNDNPRVDLLFRLVSNAEKPSSLFAYYERKEKDLLDVNRCREEWGKVKSCFLRLHNWFQDRSTYHSLGFLIASGEKIDEWWGKYSQKPMPVSNVWRERLHEKCEEQIKGWRGASYGDNNQEITSALLLLNILSLPKEDRFPFHRYHQEKWSLEHINPQNPSTEGNYDSEYDRSLHMIQNMALLASGDNSSLGNKSFNEKREVIINLDKAGAWLPICTRNVFLRYYRENIEDPKKWTVKDQGAYLEAMTGKLDNITF